MCGFITAINFEIIKKLGLILNFEKMNKHRGPDDIKYLKITTAKYYLDDYNYRY